MEARLNEAPPVVARLTEVPSSVQPAIDIVPAFTLTLTESASVQPVIDIDAASVTLTRTEASRFRPSRLRLPSTLKLAPIASVPVPVREREAVAGTTTDPLARSDGTSPLKRNEKRPAASAPKPAACRVTVTGRHRVGSSSWRNA